VETVVDTKLAEQLRSLAFPQLRLFAPGPHELSPAVCEVLETYRATYTHRASEFKTCYEETENLLRKTFYIPDSYRPLIFGHTGSYNWEMVATNTPRTGRTLGLNIGSFSKRWGQVFTDLGRHIDLLSADLGDGITPDQLRSELPKGYDLVLLIHNETSTGVALDVEALCKVVREESPDTLIGIDAVSIAGAVDIHIDTLKPDYYLWSLQKDFSIPTIGSVMIVSDRAMKIAGTVEHRGYVLDMVEWVARAEKHQTPMTVPDLTLRCITARLKEMLAEGDARFKRHETLTAQQHAWAAGRGLALLSKPGFESPTLSTISVPAGVTGPELTVAAKKHLNAQIAAGYGSTADGYIRIASMGTTSEKEMEQLLNGLSLILENWDQIASPTQES
jgi:aspartate aminotransferase-like enzyme